MGSSCLVRVSLAAMGGVLEVSETERRYSGLGFRVHCFEAFILWQR